MAYNVNIPQPTDKFSTSQPQILQNFQALDVYTQVDHVALNAANQGKHKTATFPTAGAPGAVGAAEVGIYSANGPTSAVPELFINKTASQIPFTEALRATTGWTWLPSGIMLQWGFATMAGGASSVVVALSRAFPTAILSVTALPNTLPAGNYTDNILAIVQTDVSHVTAYRKTNFGSACTFNYLAIGY